MSKNQFTERQKEAIQLAIAKAELNTSGEIRVHIDKQCKVDPIKRAIVIFEELKMYNTAQKNGILIYLSLNDHKLAIIGDSGINDVVPDDFWDNERDLMISFFKKGQFTEGLIEGIRMVGDQLKSAFPYLENDTNELSNEVSFGEDE